jgi:GH24 family phage-related lysozyme (muramidase)
MPQDNMPERVFELLSGYEGFRPKPYTDSKKLWTIGIGTLIGDGSDKALKESPFYNKTISAEQAAELAKRDIQKKAELISGMVGEDKFNSFSPELQAHLVSGAYRGDITGSPKTIRLLKEGNFEAAAKEYLDNEEYRKSSKGSAGVVKRMNDAAAVIAKEKPVDFSTAVERAITQAGTATATTMGPPTPEQQRDVMARRVRDATKRGEASVVKPLRNPRVGL